MSPPGTKATLTSPRWGYGGTPATSTHNALVGRRIAEGANWQCHTAAHPTRPDRQPARGQVARSTSVTVTGHGPSPDTGPAQSALTLETSQKNSHEEKKKKKKYNLFLN